MQTILLILILIYINIIIHHKLDIFIKKTGIRNALYPKHYCRISLTFQRLCRIHISYDLIPKAYKVIIALNLLVWVMIVVCPTSLLYGEFAFGIVFLIIFTLESIELYSIYIIRWIFRKYRLKSSK